MFILQSQNARDRGKDLKVPYVLEVVTLVGNQFQDDEGEQMTSCVPKVVDAATKFVRQTRLDTDTDRAVLGVLTMAPQSAKVIREAVKRKDKAVRDSLARLQGREQAEHTKDGWVRAA